jgi:hypothetical protein
MSTTPTPIARQPKVKKVAAEKHSVQLQFTEKYLSLYNQLKSEAEQDDRPLHIYILRLLQSAQTNSAE